MQAYQAWLVCSDIMLMGIAMMATILLQGKTDDSLSTLGDVSYGKLVPVFMLGVVIVLWLCRAYNRKMIGIGLQEYRRVVIGVFSFFGAMAIVSYLFKVSFSRSVFVVGMPTGILLLLIGRWLCRQGLSIMRNRGWAYLTLVVGYPDAVRTVLKQLAVPAWAGYRPVAVLLSGKKIQEKFAGMQQEWSNLCLIQDGNLEESIVSDGIGAVIVAGGVAPGHVRALSWRLERFDVEFLVNPSVTDIAGPRMAVRGADGLSFVHVDLPEFGGWKIVAKRIFDVVFSSIVLIVGSPVYMVIALAVKLGDGGPVFFRQERVGLNGDTFQMHKFRTMCVDAEEKLAVLKAERGVGGLLFKLENDPRITKVGKVLRKYSLDELPQFWDAFRGKMSVVGPRPALPREVSQYKDHHHRRLLVKPGLTGPWQVSGRSNLSTDQYFRLDLDYVENWSFILDMLMVLRTVKVMVKPEGAH
jgi:exopolysaccharide biosynthesis polyprenyl glycosylphosphotransferase